MQINFRLKQLLLDRGEKERGLINRVAADTNLKRHQVAALLQNRVKHLPLDTLGAVCQYLIDNKGISKTDLPAILFALEPEKFWDLLGKRKFVEICFGVRPEEEVPDMIVAADSYLHGVVLKQLFESTPHNHGPAEGYSLKQRHVTAFGSGTSNDDAIAEAKEVYQDFNDHAGSRALVCLGSIKSNPVIEIPIASVFNAEAFSPQDDVATPSDRSCPFFLCYREKDAKAPSCYAGDILAKSRRKTVPGIYYEKPDGNWSVCKWSSTEDAALVVYVEHKTSGIAEVAMGGFSSRSTHSLAEALPTIASKLWPPAIDATELALGVYIVRFKYKQPPGAEREDEFIAHRSAVPSRVDVIPISAEAIHRHRGTVAEEEK